MNKYLEKIAYLDFDHDEKGNIKIATLMGPGAKLGKAESPLKAKAAGSKLASGAKTLFAKALIKKAFAPMSRGQPTENAHGGLAVSRDHADAALMSKANPDHKSELRDTAVIAASGSGMGLLGTKILDRMNPKPMSTGRAIAPYLSKEERFMKGVKGNAKTLAVMGGLGLVGDYAAVKLNKALGNNKS